MDKFGVPKKVNRHVLKAIYLMNGGGRRTTKHSDIMKIVRTTMKGRVPSDLSQTVLRSLKNMARLGIIRRWGKNFSVFKKSYKSNGVNSKNIRGRGFQTYQLDEDEVTNDNNNNKAEETENNPVTSDPDLQHDGDKDMGTVDAKNAACTSEEGNPEAAKQNEASSVEENEEVAAEKQSDTTSQCSVRKVYESNHFSKDSNIEIETNQEMNVSEEKTPSVTNVVPPNSEETLCSPQKEDEQPNDSIPSKIISIDSI